MNIAKFSLPMKSPSKTHAPAVGTCIAVSQAYRSETRNIERATQRAMNVKPHKRG